MANQQLVDFIKQQLEQGRSKEEIKLALLGSGWPELEIDGAFNESGATPPLKQMNGLSPTSPPTKSRKKIIMAAILIIGLALIGGGLLFWHSNQTEKSITPTPTPGTTEFPVSRLGVAMGVRMRYPQLPVEIEFLGKENDQYLLSAKHTQNQSCAQKTLHLPTESVYTCNDKSYRFNLYATESNDKMVYFSIKEVNTADLFKTPTPKPTATPTKPASQPIVNCGENGPSNPDTDRAVRNCIEAKFKTCQPATYTASIDMSPLGGIWSYYYEIIGPSNNLCSVKTKYLRNINPAWVGPEMACEYDNKKDFETATNELITNLKTANCTGPLYNLMTGQ